MTQDPPRSTNLLAAPVVLLLVVVCALTTWPRERRNPIAAVPSMPRRTEQAVVVPAHKFTNELMHETSPYLRQHAHNPVNWRPWGDKAFDLARRENKPVFLSVGYSTCYWCHVMERESFENEEVAALLNEHFICIKVDREELPDVDEQYLLATQIMGGRGGWPNSVWLMPDRRPWMAGTYIPRAAFLKGLQQLAELWRDEPATIERQAAAFEQEIRRIAVSQQGFEEQPLNREMIERYLTHVRREFDAKHGGFGDKPKFPPHGDLRLLTHEAQRSGDEQLTQMVTQTLDAIAAGGIRDHLGGGFHRYATDDHWFLPHFEKMLYDNAQLLRAYTEGYRLTGNEYYREVVAEIFAWLQREMTHPAGGFYSAIDAESEQEEGKFYVWSLAELSTVLGPRDAQRFATAYGATADGNFVEEATGHRSGSNVLFLPAEITDEQSSTEFAAMRNRLLAARGRRTAPHKDEKILASWNGLMIAALAQAGRELQEPAYTRAALRAADYLTLHMIDRAGLKRSASDRAARLPGYLDDHAHVIEGMLELHQTTGDARWLGTAQQLAEAMLKKFADPVSGGFYFTSAEHDSLIIRSKNLLGGGNVPSPNGVAAEVLWRLGKATGKSHYTQAAQRTLESVSGLMHRAPQATESMLLATARMLEDRDSFSQRSTADAHFNSTAVNVAAYSSATAANAGDSLRIAVRLNIAPGWHLYGENEDAEFVLPTTVALVENSWAQPTRLEVPAGLEKSDPVLKRTLQIYECEVWFWIEIAVADDAMVGKEILELQVKVQACDQNRCLPPMTTTLRLPLEIRTDAVVQPQRHPEIFHRWPSL